tara:strand:+ start:40673 stop:40873 length:201 start_codon:yes stop_codon:yes gene_type:complete
MTRFIRVTQISNNSDFDLNKAYINPEKIKTIDIYDEYAIIVLGYCQTIKIPIRDAEKILDHTGRIE